MNRHVFARLPRRPVERLRAGRGVAPDSRCESNLSDRRLALFRRFLRCIDSRISARLLVLAILFALAACSPAPEEGAEPPMLAAAEQGDLPTLEALLGDRGEVNVRDACRWTPLMKAALNGHRDVAERLLAFGAEVDAADKGGYTAMMLAASNNHADLVELLLQNGARIDQVETTSGWTALIWAAKQGHRETVELLLDYGADPAYRDQAGLTALDWARKEGHAEVAELFASAGDGTLEARSLPD